MNAPVKKRRKWASGRGVLWIVASMFAISALIRFAAGPGPALAQEMAALRGETATPPTTAAAKPAPNAAEIEKILAELKRRSAFLDERERKLDELASSLEFAKVQVRKNLQALAEAEKSLSEKLSISEKAAETDLARLTAVYENMKPKQAAALFDQMAPEFAAGFIGRMRADAAAQIMAGLKPETAYTISVILAGRNANAPTE